jgi:mRNA-degrading endonuclease RelE of RelBE toxin-antitoxin system
MGGSSKFWAINSQSEKYLCSIENKLKARNKKSNNRIKIGQYVLFQSFYGGTQAIILLILGVNFEHELWTQDCKSRFEEVYDTYVY